MRDVAAEGGPADRCGYALGPSLLQVGDNDLAGAGAVKALAQSPTDPLGASGHDDHLSGDPHRTLPCSARLAPARPASAAAIPSADALLEQRTRPEALAIGVL